MFDRICTALRVRSRLITLAIAVVLIGAAAAAANGAPAVLYRVFLKDGGVLVS